MGGNSQQKPYYITAVICAVMAIVLIVWGAVVFNVPLFIGGAFSGACAILALMGGLLEGTS